MIVETVKENADCIMQAHNLFIKVGEMLTEAHR